MSQQTNCPFCEMSTGDPGKRIKIRNELAVMVLDAYPVSPGHALVIPKRHIGSFFDTTQLEKLAMLALLERSKLWLDNEFAPDSYNLGINDGSSAGQTIQHCHIHLIPRYAGDSQDPRGGIRWLVPEKADYWSPQE